MASQDMLGLLAGYDSRTLAVWYVDLNRFEWPQDCPIPEPQGYATLSRRERHETGEGQQLWALLEQLTTREDRSRAWWTLCLGRTEAEWQDWWDGCFTHGELVSLE